MATEESKIQKKIIKYLEDEGCYVVKIVSANKSGVPDIIGCYEGWFFGIEVKTPEKRANVSKLQEHNLDMIDLAGGEARVMWSLEQAEEFILEIKDD